MSHFGFYTKVHIWLKIDDGVKSWTIVAHQHTNFFLPFLFNPLNIELHKRNEVNLIVRDLWIHVVVSSSHHKVRFFFPRIDGLFVVRKSSQGRTYW